MPSASPSPPGLCRCGDNPPLLIAAALIAALLVIAGCLGGAGRVPSDPRRLPYQFVSASPMSLPPDAVLVADFDQDGVDEQVRFVHGLDEYIDAAELAEDRGYNLTTFRPRGWGELCGVADASGDGAPEIVWYEQEGGSSWGRLVVSELRVQGRKARRLDIGTVQLEYEKPAAPGSNRVTSVFLLDAFDLDGNGTRESLACPVVTGVGRSPRGIWLVNWETDEVVWRLPTAGTPTGGWEAADVDRDGSPELIVGIESPGNGVTVGGCSDSLAYLAVIELDGSVVWQREIGGESSDISLAVADLDGDGSIEVVATVGAHKADARSGATVWGGADGQPLDAVLRGVHVNGVAVADCEEGPRVFLGSSDGTVTRLRFEGGRLRTEGSVDCGEAVDDVAAAGFGPTIDGPVIVAGLKSGSVVALDERLRPLAFLPLDDASNRRTLGAIHPATFRVGGKPVEGVHYVTLQQHRRLTLARNPLRPSTVAALVLCAALGVTIGVPPLRRGSLGLLRRWVLPRATRETGLDDLIGALATASHGKLAATSTFRRLREQASMLTLQDAEPPAAFRDRFRDAVENARDIGLALVRDILRKAARLGLAPAATAQLSRELRELSRIVSRPADAVPSPSEAVALRDRLDRILPVVTERLSAVKRAADRERSSPLMKGISRAVAARRDELVASGVSLVGPAAFPGGGPRVAAAATEVSFIIENLLANAARAVEGRSDPRITVDVTLDGEGAVVTVEDNGKGIPPEKHAVVFEEGVSDRAGGGHGLAESRRILASKGGSIKIARSAPGEGAAFAVRFRVVP